MMVPSWKLGRPGLFALVLLAAQTAGYGQTLPLSYDQEQALRQPNGSEMFVDAVVARPLGLFAMAIGAVTYVVSLPFSLPSHSADSAAKGLVVDPTKFTFKRPLGRFVSCDDQPDFCK
jgi:hypothetical protein